jgi:hypothetical protein
MVTFVFTNPKHHVDAMVPVAKRLAATGVPTRFVSLAELRGLRTPDLSRDVPMARVDRVLPSWVRKDSSAGASIGQKGGAGALARRVVQAITWRGLLRPRLSRLLRGSDVVVVPNDAAYPYGALAAMLRTERVPFVLLQEGIRFPLPSEQRAGVPYGSAGANAICVWGEASAEHFRQIAPQEAVHVTGNPRWDDVDPASWVARGAKLMKRLGLERRPLLYLSNTVDDQGFCTTAEKYQLFADFIARAAPILDGRAIVVKLHGREDVKAFRRVAADQRAAAVHVLGDESLFETLAIGQAAVVLASTVGLEALAFGLPLGVLALPGHGHIFEYVSRGAARGLTLGNLTSELPPLLSAPHSGSASEAFLERHMAHRGQAASRIASCLLVLRQKSTNKGTP